MRAAEGEAATSRVGIVPIGGPGSPGPDDVASRGNEGHDNWIWRGKGGGGGGRGGGGGWVGGGGGEGTKPTGQGGGYTVQRFHKG